MIDFLTGNYLEIAKGVLMVLGGFSILAKLTPTQADDKIIAKLLAVIHTFGLTK